jgi:hypothetical protein
MFSYSIYFISDIFGSLTVQDSAALEVLRFVCRILSVAIRSVTINIDDAERKKSGCNLIPNSDKSAGIRNIMYIQ